jgi:hypothetical protein
VHARTVARLAAHVGAPAQTLGAFAHDLESELAAALRRRRHRRVETDAVVLDRDVPGVRFEPEAHGRARSVSVLAYICQRLLDDPQQLYLGDWL